ncbi:MAG TPA: hypothetical protein VLF91_02690 [Candidatus Saccharimonadales bacterium]|nr:hypothetical protein [Candidatus Saccharimonadales bacterium]
MGDETRYEAFSPDETLALAEAMAQRAEQLSVLRDRALASLAGEPYEAKSVEDARSALLGRTIMYLARIESPNAPLSFAQLVDAENEDGTYAAVLRKAREGGAKFGVDTIREFMHTAAQEMQAGSGVTNERVAANFAGMLAAARQVAVEHSVGVPAVYAMDGLYFEACRRSSTPAEVVEELRSKHNALSTDMITRLISIQIEQALPKDARDAMTPEDLAELSGELRTDPGIQAGIAQQVELSKEVGRQFSFYLFVRTFGLVELDRLSREQQAALLPRRPFASEVFGSIN